MIWSKKTILRGFLLQTRGTAAVEFAILGTLFVLLLGGIVDFGHAYFMKQVVTNASREGARYGVTYRTNSGGARIAPSGLSPTIPQYLTSGYLQSAHLPADSNPAITMAGTGYTTGAKGDKLEVTVAATKTWFFVSGLVPGMGSHITLRATTVMQCE